MMTKSFMDSSYDSNQSDGSGDQDDGADDGLMTRTNSAVRNTKNRKRW